MKWKMGIVKPETETVLGMVGTVRLVNFKKGTNSVHFM
jgi:hypothetical protein